MLVRGTLTWIVLCIFLDPFFPFKNTAQAFSFQKSGVIGVMRLSFPISPAIYPQRRLLSVVLIYETAQLVEDVGVACCLGIAEEALVVNGEASRSARRRKNSACMRNWYPLRFS